MAIFKAQINRKITKAMTGRKARASAIKKMSNDFNRAKNQFLREVPSDPSSVGVATDKETRAYFGLRPSEDPVGNLVDVLNEKVQLDKRPVTKRSANTASYKFTVKYPSKPEIYSESFLSLPWTAKTWVQALQEGLGNIENFLFKPGAGRSKGGIQVKSPIGNYEEERDPSYLERLRSIFSTKLKGGR